MLSSASALSTADAAASAAVVTQTWLAAGILPGGLDALDRHSYEQALATYAVLQDAASKGLESLEQVRMTAAAAYAQRQ
jgi:hypothetical protein